MTSASALHDTIVTDKRSMRDRMRAAIGALTAQARADEAETACAAIRSFPRWQAARRVLAYASAQPLEGTQTRYTPELETEPLIRAAWSNGRVVCLPVVDWERHAMAPVALHGPEHPTEIRRHGIPEPIGGDAVEPVTLDVVLVPGLAFDTEGRRLGRGGGYYDRFLTEILRTPSVNKPMLIGVGFACQLVERVPAEAHDVMLDAVVLGSRGVVWPASAPATSD